MMARALELAERGLFTTKPNPMVGCVIAQGDEVVGEGFHVRQGGAHAEVLALQAAGERARGATAYVTLEPCAHAGHTGPCADALVEAGVARVVAAMRDPFPPVDGKGFERLQAAGIEVASGLMAAQARELNAGSVSRVERGRPRVRVKLAMSRDGRTALASGESKWITGEASRLDGHRWRARAGAILAGAGTILTDDPQLTVRLGDDTPFVAPTRVVLDPGLATIARGRVREGDAPTLYLHAPDVKPPRDMTTPRAAVPMHNGVLDLRAVLQVLVERGINEVHVETGATRAGALLSEGLVDELLLYVAPVLLGDSARPLFAGLKGQDMAHRYCLRAAEPRQVGEDLRIRLRPAPGTPRP